jgi:hypothetical protein
VLDTSYKFTETTTERNIIVHDNYIYIYIYIFDFYLSINYEFEF